jgi:hypothetical protein
MFPCENSETECSCCIWVFCGFNFSVPFYTWPQQDKQIMLNKITTLISNDSQEHWDTIITPQKKWFEFRLEEIWHARELLGLFVWRDLISVYKQTILGPFWYFLQPTLQALMYFFIFGAIARLPTDDIPAFVFYLAGTILWGFFSSNIYMARYISRG